MKPYRIYVWVVHKSYFDDRYHIDHIAKWSNDESVKGYDSFEQAFAQAKYLNQISEILDT